MKRWQRAYAREIGPQRAIAKAAERGLTTRARPGRYSGPRFYVNGERLMGKAERRKR
jgi:hypothetical protein